MSSVFTNNIPKPGIYHGLAAEDYHAWTALSNTWLTKLAETPLHLLSHVRGDDADTAAKRFGRAVHAAILEPDSFGRAYVRLPEPDPAKYCKKDGTPSKNPAATSAYKAEVAVALSGGGEGMVADEYDRCLSIRDSMLLTRTGRDLLSGESELSLAWEYDGISCKARLDHRAEADGGKIVDLKTTLDASADGFERIVYERGYHRQAAWYKDACNLVGLPAKHFILVALDKKVSGVIGFYRVLDDAIEHGREEIAPLLDRYNECMAFDTWPGLPDEIMDIGLPGYSLAKIQRKEQAATKVTTRAAAELNAAIGGR